MSTSIAVIGAGNIGEALISGLVSSGVNPETITATNRTESRREELARRYGVITTDDNIEAVTDAEVCFLCVKPYAVADMIEELSEAIASNDTSTVLVSMAAGVTLDAMSDAVHSAGTPLARVMPNTPMQVGKGVCVVAFGRFVEEDQQELVTELLGATGKVVVVPESLMDAASAISGSGPAYFFLVAEALVDSAVSLGLPRDTATVLASATAEGAGAMLAHSGKTPVELRAGVSSPAGTTVKAIRELEESGVRGAFYRATEAAAARAAEMGK